MKEGIWVQGKARLVSRECDMEEGADRGVSPCPTPSGGSHIGCQLEEAGKG